MNAQDTDAVRDRLRRSDKQAPRQRDSGQLAVRTLTSNSLFAGEHEIGIEHHGALYRLKITRQGKLILNK